MVLWFSLNLVILARILIIPIYYRASFRTAMSDLIQLRYNRTAADKVSFMVLTATPTDQIIDRIYQTVGFNLQDHKVLYICESLDRPNIFLEVKKKTKFEVSVLTFIQSILQCIS